jgi:hypothetical protein
MNYGSMIGRCDFDRCVRFAGGGTADEQGQSEAFSFHFTRHVGHFFQ